MSFCENIKEEIQKADCRNKNCSLAFISGFAAFTLSVEDEKAAFLADGEEIGKKMSYLMKKQFSIGDGRFRAPMSAAEESAISFPMKKRKQRRYFPPYLTKTKDQRTAFLSTPNALVRPMRCAISLWARFWEAALRQTPIRYTTLNLWRKGSAR